MSKGWGSNIENVQLICERITLIIYIYNYISSLFWKYTHFSNHLVWIHKTNHVNFRIGQKWEDWCALNNVLNL
jgi:hypothetical protein